MNFDFPFILVCLTAVSGMVWLVDGLFFANKRQPQYAADGKLKLPLLADYARSFFPVLLFVLIVRSFVLQPFRVTTGSLEPTVIPGDFLVVNMFKYGLRLPVWHTKIMKISEPKRGDIMLFRWPKDERQDFVKRVIGVPGDHISYINKVFYINGTEAKQTLVANATDTDDSGAISWPVKVYEEDLGGVKHKIYIRTDRPAEDFKDLVVPEGHYLMIGDNRDNSNDSRYWGFVPEKNIIGKALYVWLSWDNENHKVRWDRFGDKLFH
jgi:signal peptidase I